jgi:RNA polymerase sigma-70 factor (ECF subfamily)
MAAPELAQKFPASTTREWDTRVVLGILDSDADAVEELYARYRARVYHFALSRLRNHHDAEDLTQEVFIRVITNMHTFRGQSRLLTWIFGIANILTLKHQQNKHNRIKRASEDELADVPSLATIDRWIERKTDATRLLRRCSLVLENNVSPQQKRIFQMMYEENASIRTISHEVGIGIGAVKSSLRNTRRVLFQKARNGPR